MSIKEPSIDELERLQNTFLFKIPDFYKDKAHSNYQDILYKLFFPILEYFVNNLKWFNIWRKIVGEEIPQLYFLVDEDPGACTLKIVNMYRSLEWKKRLFDYVTIPSMFCQKYDKEDVSFMYTINNLEEEDQFSEMNKYIITLNLKDIILVIQQYNYSNDSQSLEEKVIGGLKHYYSELKKNNNLIIAIHNKLKQTFENQDIEKEDVIKLINCYFWVRFAYPEEWKVMLYSPGIIAKEVDSIPFGVNIGLKENPSLNVILFLKKITLLFFTRESVDFFEEKAQKEKELRLAIFREAYHDITRNIIPPILDELEKPNVNNIKWLVEYLRDKLEILKSIAIDDRNINQSKSTFSIKERIANIYNRLSFDNKNKLHLAFLNRENYKIQINPRAFDLIFENLIANSGRHGGRPRDIENVQININISRKVNSIVIDYHDTGKGFEESAMKNVDRWTNGSFTDKELITETGLGFWMIQKACNFIGFEFTRNWGNIIDGKVYKPYFKFIYWQ